MRYILSFLLVAWLVSAQAQIQGEAMPPENKVNEFSEWVSATQTLPSGQEVNFEYRIKLIKKAGMACHYELEVKNLSDKKVTVEVSYSYYDKLAKGNFSGNAKLKLKANATGSAKLITQGCKKAKDATEKDDYSVCTACGMSYELIVNE